jgi:hypothetical protein
MQGEVSMEGDLEDATPAVMNALPVLRLSGASAHLVNAVLVNRDTPSQGERIHYLTD